MLLIVRGAMAWLKLRSLNDNQSRPWAVERSIAASAVLMAPGCSACAAAAFSPGLRALMRSIGLAWMCSTSLRSTYVKNEERIEQR
jgi:hypothetical protein